MERVYVLHCIVAWSLWRYIYTADARGSMQCNHEAFFYQLLLRVLTALLTDFFFLQLGAQTPVRRVLIWRPHARLPATRAMSTHAGVSASVCVLLYD